MSRMSRNRSRLCEHTSRCLIPINQIRVLGSPVEIQLLPFLLLLAAHRVKACQTLQGQVPGYL